MAACKGSQNGGNIASQDAFLQISGQTSFLNTLQRVILILNFQMMPISEQSACKKGGWIEAAKEALICFEINANFGFSGDFRLFFCGLVLS